MSRAYSPLVGIGFVLTLIAIGGCASKNRKYIEDFTADLPVLNKICVANNAGDRVYRRVDEVVGVFKANVVNPNPDWSDQYGMEAPFVNTSVSTGLYTSLFESGGRYWFIEAPPAYGSPANSAYRRKYLYVTDQIPSASQFDGAPPSMSEDGHLLAEKEIHVGSLLSRYAWTVDDLTTKEMRKHWITGGRIRIFDQISGETLAERVNFYRATGPSVQMAWTLGVGCDNPSAKYAKDAFVAENDALFVKYVLKPISARPTQRQLDQYARE